MDPEHSYITHEEWVKQYGKTFRIHGFGAFDYRLMSFDLRAISYIMNSPTFEKPWQTRRLLMRLLGRGIFAMEGEEHRIQRRIIGPAFSTFAIKNLAPIMFQKAEELKEKWSSMIHENYKSKWDEVIASLPEESLPLSKEEATKFSGGAIVDIAHWISRATFDIIGLSGFDYAFNALENETEDVYLAYRTMFCSIDKGPGFKRILGLYFPIIETLWPDESIRQLRASLKTIRKRGEEIVRSKRQTIMAEVSNPKGIWDKDILSILIKANLSENPAHRLSDSELLDQISTFLFAGSDTTSISIAWVFHFLALYPEVQDQLRDELTALRPDPLSQEDPLGFLDLLPLLDAVVRETLRLAPPVHGTIRVAMKDEIVPLSEPTTLQSGERVNQVHIRKGSYVHIPIEGLNYSKEIWGDDALVFKPERWGNLPTSATHYPGLANVMSFSYGPHACIGWKFSLLEMKVFIAALLPHFTFVPVAEIKKYNAIITRAYVEDRFEHGPALPIKILKYVPPKPIS